MNALLLATCFVLPTEDIDFARDVLPILSDNCFHCHGPDEGTREADLRLDTAAGALEDSEVIVAGKSHESELLRRILSDDPDEVMPPPALKRSLSNRQKDIVRRWIDGGAKWGKHWAFVKPVKPEPPAVQDKDGWVRNDIDRFVLSQLQSKQRQPMDAANKRTLIRRVSLDLTGLPPSVQQVDKFIADTSPNAYEKALDRLLASPDFGERMAWDWLDIARYADTNGYQGDRTRTMWPWRDWVVNAFNDNMPYDQFTVEQLAGDMIPNATMAQKIATGFHRNHMINGEGGRIAEENRVEYIFDQVETTSTTWLGLTMTCSRCHDHKYDPITLDDYYGLFAVFNQTPVNGGGGNGQTPPVVAYTDASASQQLKQLRDRMGELANRIEGFEVKFFPRPEGKSAGEAEKAKGLAKEFRDELKKPVLKRDPKRFGYWKGTYNGTAPEYVKWVNNLGAAMKKRDSIRSKLPQVMVMADGKKRDTFVLKTGIYNQRDRKVVSSVVRGLNEPPRTENVDRLTLAKWIVDPENPLTARVTVNRLWQTFFGAGLVRTPEDFGVQGQRPTHPALLDWLAVDFVESGWDVKRFVKQIMMSSTYRQSSEAGAEAYANDPDNRLLARGPRFRLPSWMIRDQALAISGLLNRDRGGPSVNSYQPEGIWAEATFGKIKYKRDAGNSLYRRSLYLFWRRIVGPTTFFDVAKRQTCEVKPPRTNSPLHALVTMNDVTYVEAARVFAERILSSSDNDEERIRSAFKHASGRTASAREVEVLTRQLATLRTTYSDDRNAAKVLSSTGEAPRNEKLDATEVAAFTGLCNLILNLDEVITRE
ncbi:MAG: PSD1 and planctomycete cytochrome C domain-containing protein [Planctomycetaceae bacterium]